MTLTKRTLLQGLLAAPALAAPMLLFRSEETFAQTSKPRKYNDNPGYYRYRVGDFEVTALLDGYFELPTNIILGYDQNAAKEATKKSYRRFTTGSVPVPVNGYVINTGKEMILLDAGAPAFISPTLGQLTANMEAAGIKPKDITTVLLTHTHPDHVAALAGKDGNRYFANATLMCSQAEWSYIHNDDIRKNAPKDFREMIDYARSVLAPYKDNRKLFTGKQELLDGITSSPLPGHTPGHTGYEIHSKGERLFFWGDVIHFSTLQFANPDWKIVFDADVEQANKSRRAILARASADQMAIAGAHIDFPGIGYVEKSGESYRYVPAPWMPT